MLPDCFIPPLLFWIRGGDGWIKQEQQGVADVTECNVVRRTAEPLNKEPLFSFSYCLARCFCPMRLNYWCLWLFFFLIFLRYFNVRDSHLRSFVWWMYQRAALELFCKEKRFIPFNSTVIFSGCQNVARSFQLWNHHNDLIVMVVGCNPAQWQPKASSKPHISDTDTCGLFLAVKTG